MPIQDSTIEHPGSLQYAGSTEGDWPEEPEQLPRRARPKLLAPLPLSLLGVLLIAGGFFAGATIEKNQGGQATSGAGALSGFSLKGGARAGARTAGGSGGGFPGATSGAGSGSLTSGEVSSVSGDTLYVAGSDENTVKVKVPSGARVTKTVTTSVKGVHPGDTVTVTGSQGTGGSITATAVAVGSASSSSAAATGTSAGATGTALFGAG